MLFWKTKIAFFLTILLTALGVTTASAFCSEPSVYAAAPSFYEDEPDAPGSYQVPDVPYCLSEYSYSGSHTCEQWELDSYFDEVNGYVDDLDSYLQDAKAYANDAMEFANEAISFANEIENFAAQAYDFALCEANEVKAQHE